MLPVEMTLNVQLVNLKRYKEYILRLILYLEEMDFSKQIIQKLVNKISVLRILKMKEYKLKELIGQKVIEIKNKEVAGGETFDIIFGNNMVLHVSYDDYGGASWVDDNLETD
jgi:hypothetical protein